CLAAALGATIAFPAAALAQVSWQARMLAQSGYTDNILSAQEHAPPGQPSVEGDGMTTLRPSLAASYWTNAAIYRLEYLFSASLYWSHSEANAYSHALSLASFLRPSATSQLHMGAIAAYSRAAGFSQLPSAAQASAGAILPPGAVDSFSLIGNETFA